MIGFVHVRHPFDLGGLYYCFNAVMSMLSVLASAVIYSLCVPAATIHGVVGSTINGTESNGMLASTSESTSLTSHALAKHTATSSTGASLSLGKIDDFTLTVSVATLITVWVISAVGFLLTIKRKFIRTFVSTQTGCGYARSIFLDHEGNDAMRIHLFSCNERQWRSIRDLVRQWVRSMYAVWEQLRPTWFNESLQMRIPDDFMPPQVVVQLNAQAPSGRRRTLDGMGLLRRMTLTSGSDVLSEATPDSASGLDVPSGKAASTAIASSAATGAAGPLGIEAGAPLRRGLDRLKPDDSPNVPVDDEYQMMQTMPEEVTGEEAHADGAVQSDDRHSWIEPADCAELAAGFDNGANIKVVDLEAL